MAYGFKDDKSKVDVVELGKVLVRSFSQHVSAVFSSGEVKYLGFNFPSTMSGKVIGVLSVGSPDIYLEMLSYSVSDIGFEIGLKNISGNSVTLDAYLIVKVAYIES